ncbi:MAG: hypothetical protein C0413_00890 [Clostridiales bacterium]|nr:hypothetical protein [Clostridiales bacterium]
MRLVDRVRAQLNTFRSRHPLSEMRPAINLLIFQLIFVVLLLATIILCFFVDQGGRLQFYLLLLGGLMVVVLLALILNFRGKFRASTWMTAICMVLGPWISILFDPAVVAGDFVPLIYVALSIQLCSILLQERVTILVSAIQLCATIAFVLLNPALHMINWPSLITFIVFTAIIGVLYGFSSKRQMAEIEKQRNRLLREEDKLRALTVRDPLTGLYNRRYMEETLDREIQRAIRKQQPLAVIMADIDGFKNINDTIGHVLGDKALVKVSAFLIKNTRASDVVCRFGGDEFCLILPDCHLEEGFRRAEALRLGVESLHADGSDGIERFTVSFGVSVMPDDGMTREALLGAADSALYSAKRAGRNRVSGTQNRP